MHDDATDVHRSHRGCTYTARLVWRGFFRSREALTSPTPTHDVVICGGTCAVFIDLY